MSVSRLPHATRALAAIGLAAFIGTACQATPVGSVTVSSPAVQSQAVPTQAPASPSAAVVAATARPTPFYPSVLRRPTGLIADGTCEDSYSCVGLLGTAKHHSALFAPGFSFTMPVAGWENTLQEGGVMPFLPIASPGDGIYFFRGPQATKPDGTVQTSIPSEVGPLADWLTANKDLSASAPVDVSVGGLKGVRIDLAVAPDSTSHTTDCKVVTCVWFFRGKDPSSKPTWLWDFGVMSSERLRVYLLQAKDSVITVIADSFDGRTWDDLTATTDQFLSSVKFDKS